MVFKIEKALKLTILILSFHFSAYTTNIELALRRLLSAYPQIQITPDNCIIWEDGSKMSFDDTGKARSKSEKLNHPGLRDQLEQPTYNSGIPYNNPEDDPGRIRYEPFFRKMYGHSPEEVESNLEKVIWMPKTFGPDKYILPVTRVNNIYKKIEAISNELEELVIKYPEYIKFLESPGGTFNWRLIANTIRLSNHSFGMTIDINAAQSNYWQWDLKKEGKPILEDSELEYCNYIPWEIIEIFEKHGFIWGGKWKHYDTMHFEYRPELID